MGARAPGASRLLVYISPAGATSSFPARRREVTGGELDPTVHRGNDAGWRRRGHPRRYDGRPTPFGTDQTVMSEQNPLHVALKRTNSQARAEAWALALASQGISSWINQLADQWWVHVFDVDAPRAAATLDVYDRENDTESHHVANGESAGFPTNGSAASFVPAVGIAIALVAAHAWIASANSWVVPLGSARAVRILQGEWWRSATALTLHADVFHVLANAIFGALFLGVLFLRSGVGVGLGVTLGAATMATFVNVALRGPGYDGLGASTAVFAALGATAGLAMRDAVATRRGVWLPLLAAAVMLALFGTSERSDVMAHALGFGFGVAAGLLLAVPIRRYRSLPVVQWTAGAGAVAFLIAAWGLALSRGVP